MIKILTSFSIILFIFLLPRRCYAQQEVNCQPVCVLGDSVSNSITTAQLLKLKGPRLIFPQCDTVRKDVYLKTFTVYCLRESEMLWVKTCTGKNAGFDKQTLDVIKTLNTGDTIYLKNIYAATGNVDEALAPVKLQVAGDGVVEKKTLKKRDGTTSVTRTITIADAVNGVKRKGMTVARDTTLAVSLVEQVKSGALKAYPALNFEAGNPLSTTEITRMFAMALDSIMVEDVDGTLIKKTLKRPFDYCSISSFKVMQEWSPGEESDEDKVVILAIAPISDYYDEEENVWAHRPLFWIKYEDVAGIIEDFDTEHPKSTFSKAVWKDFLKAK